MTEEWVEGEELKEKLWLNQLHQKARISTHRISLVAPLKEAQSTERRDETLEPAPGDLKVDIDQTVGYVPKEAAERRKRVEEGTEHIDKQTQRNEGEPHGRVKVRKLGKPGRHSGADGMDRPWEVEWEKKREINRGNTGRLLKLKITVRENDADIEWGRQTLANVLTEFGLRCVLESEETDFREHLIHARRMRLMSFAMEAWTG